MWDQLDGYVKASSLMQRFSKYFEDHGWKKRKIALSNVDVRKIVQQELKEELLERDEIEEMPQMATMAETASEQRLRGTYTRSEQMAELCEGSIGAMVFLKELEVMKRAEIDLYLRALDDLGIYEDELYRLWDECCSRDATKAAGMIRCCMEGDVTEDTLHEWIREGKKLNPEWIRVQRMRKQEERYEERNDKG